MRQERLSANAAKRSMVREAFRDGGAPERTSLPSRILARLRGRGRA
jgi:hypothetical protein